MKPAPSVDKGEGFGVGLANQHRQQQQKLLVQMPPSENNMLCGGRGGSFAETWVMNTGDKSPSREVRSGSGSFLTKP